MDFDRVPEDRKRGRAPEKAKGSEQLQFVYVRPNLGGLLLRLCAEHENRFVDAKRALPLLRQNWPEYAKPMSAAALERRFSLSDLRRASKYDADLRRVLGVIGLMDNT